MILARFSKEFFVNLLKSNEFKTKREPLRETPFNLFLVVQCIKLAVYLDFAVFNRWLTRFVGTKNIFV